LGITCHGGRIFTAKDIAVFGLVEIRRG